MKRLAAGSLALLIAAFSWPAPAQASLVEAVNLVEVDVPPPAGTAAAPSSSLPPAGFEPLALNVGWAQQFSDHLFRLSRIRLDGSRDLSPVIETLRQAPPEIRGKLLKTVIDNPYRQLLRKAARRQDWPGLRLALKRVGRLCANPAEAVQIYKQVARNEAGHLELDVSSPQFGKQNSADIAPVMAALAQFYDRRGSRQEASVPVPAWAEEAARLGGMDARALHEAYQKFEAKRQQAYEQDASENKAEFHRKVARHDESLAVKAGELFIEPLRTDGQVAARAVQGNKIVIIAPALDSPRLKRSVADTLITRDVDSLLTGQSRPIDSLSDPSLNETLLASIALPGSRVLELRTVDNPMAWVSLNARTLFPLRLSVRRRSELAKATPQPLATFAFSSHRRFELLGPETSAFRSVTLANPRTGQISHHPALRSVWSWDYWKQWRDTLQWTFTPGKFYGNLVRGLGIGSAEASLACLGVFFSIWLQPHQASFHFLAVLIPGIRGFLKAFYVNIYADNSDRGNNPTWRALKRLLINLPFAIVLATTTSVNGWAILLTTPIWYSLLAVGMVDRKYSVDTTILLRWQKDHHLRSSLPSWLSLKRSDEKSLKVLAPGRAWAARILRVLGRDAWAENVGKATIRDVPINMGLMEIARFPITPLGVLVDPIVMAWTSIHFGAPLPLIMMSLWILSYGVETVFYRRARALLRRYPHKQKLREDFHRQRAQSLVWQMLDPETRPLFWTSFKEKWTRLLPSRRAGLLKDDSPVRVHFVFGGLNRSLLPAAAKH